MAAECIADEKRFMKTVMRNSYIGFTLIELMIVLAIAGIALSAAIPSFQGMVVRNRIITQANEFVLTLNLARSEALKVGGIVTIQAASPVTGNRFGGGWCVVVGNPGNCDGTLVRRFPALTGETTLDSVEGVNFIQFNSLGGLANTASTTRKMDLCYPGYDGRRIVISLIGRSKSHRPNGTDPPTSC